MTLASTHIKSENKPRLIFIDFARSIAIILMIEGHFTGSALSKDYQNDSYLLYTIWHNIHGLTSPLFFTITGVIFVYLLSADNSASFFKNERVKKGFRRVLELIFWGYFIQLNLWSISKSIYYGSKFSLDWFYSFHVLQSIGIGIFFLLLIYGVFKWIKKGSLYWYYLIGGIAMFICYGYMRHYIQMDELEISNALKNGRTLSPHYFPHKFPSFIQNMFYGKFSSFTFLRYSIYVILGGMLGSIIRIFEHKTKEWWFGTIFLAAGIIISNCIQPLLRILDGLLIGDALSSGKFFVLTSFDFIRFGQVVSILGLLMLMVKFFTIKAKLFLKLGQNTLPIYVVHVIILYGGILGVGLNPLLFNENLNPWMAAGISATAILLFTIMVAYIEIIKGKYSAFIRLITFKNKK